MSFWPSCARNFAQAAFDGWVRECAADDDCRAAFPDPAGDLAKVLADLDAEPKRLEVIDQKTQETVEVVLSRSSLVQTLRYMLYGSMNSLKVPAFLHAAAEGDWQPMAQTAYSVAGALMVNYGKSYFTAALPEVWLFALGALFVLVTLFLPKGVTGLLKRKEAAA